MPSVPIAALVTGIFLAAPSVAMANTIWGNDSGHLIEWDITLGGGLPLHDFSTGYADGVGIAKVGNILYWTAASSGNVFKMDATTGAPLGIAFSVAGANLGSISYDGTNFWVANAAFPIAYLMSPTGTQLKTFLLAHADNFYTGLEYFNGMLIAGDRDGRFAFSNRYSVYDAQTGALITPEFIRTDNAASLNTRGTGIAYDGTNFYVADFDDRAITIWNGTTGSYSSVVLASGHSDKHIDLSFDFAQRPDTCGGPNQSPCTITAPEPDALGLFGVALIGIGTILRWRRA